MAAHGPDPYEMLGVRPEVSDDELQTAYRRLVQLHHPDHNAGSAESARRFEAVQEAYTRIRELRKTSPRPDPPRSAAAADPDADSRLADMEREIREAQLARDRARAAAREAAAREPAADRGRRPSDEELGYITTDDSFFKILADARAELSGRFTDPREHPAAGRVADLLDELASKLKGGQPPRAER